jgi:hypothetical protein
MGDTFMIDTRALLQLVDNQPCDSCPEGKIKVSTILAWRQWLINEASAFDGGRSGPFLL